MRDSYDALHSRRSRVREVGDIASDLAGLQRRLDIVVVDQRVAREVQDDNTVLHHRDRVLVDHVLRSDLRIGVVNQRGVDRDDICVLEYLLAGIDLLDRT